MKTPRVTLITITKDDPVGLGRTIASATALRMAGAEHVVIDGSTAPANPGLIAPENGKFVIYPRSPHGISDAFNAGLEKARGEWIWFLNGGDQVDSRLSPQCLLALLESTRADVVIGGTTYEGELEPRPHPPRELQWPPFRSWIPHPSTLVRRRLFAQFGGFDERYSIAMDYEWWLRALGPTVPVDVLSMPFAVFASGGVSQRPELKTIIRRESANALWRHRTRLWRPWLPVAYYLMRAWAVAFFSKRIGKQPRLQ